MIGPVFGTPASSSVPAASFAKSTSAWKPPASPSRSASACCARATRRPGSRRRPRRHRWSRPRRPPWAARSHGALVARERAGRRAGHGRREPVLRRGRLRQARRGRRRRLAASRRTGPINRILASRYVFGQGVDHSSVCCGITRDSAGATLHGPLRRPAAALRALRAAQAQAGQGLRADAAAALAVGQLQPVHGLARTSRSSASAAAGTLVATPAGRGPDGFYEDVAEADTFEVWADVARHYELDPDWAVVSGYSMGGYGTYRLLARWPGPVRARVVDGRRARRTSSDRSPSLRNTPLMAWAAAADELVNIRDTRAAARALDDARPALRADLFPRPTTSRSPPTTSTARPRSSSATHRVDRDPAARHLRRRPGEDSSAPHAVGRPRLLAVGPRAARRATAGARHDRRALGRLRRGRR